MILVRFSDPPLTPEPVSRMRFAGILLGVVFFYFAASRLGFLLAFQNRGGSPAWPPAGIAFAAVLLFGYRIWPAIFAGAFIANAVAYVEKNSFAAWSIPITAAICVGNTLEPVAGAWLLQRFGSARGSFRRARDAFSFVLVTMLVALLSAIIGPMVLCLFAGVPWGAFRTIWLTWWIGDIAGMLIVTPLLLTWSQTSHQAWPAHRGVEAALLAVLLCAVTQSLFGGYFSVEVTTPLSYLTLPFLVWAAFRFGPRGSATAAALISILAIWGTIHNHGPFARPSLNTSLLLLQTFICVIAAVAIVLATTVEELNRSAAEIARNNQELTELAYVVSHDLKAPLRAISGLAGWIADDYRAILDEQGKENLQLLVGRAHRMSNLIEGILAYSRAGQQGLNPQLIDSKSVIFDVLATLAPPDHIEVATEGDFPTVIYDKTQLVQIFQNLIDNAIKHLGKPRGKVVVSCRDAGSSWEFCVRDNGVGIAEEHFERIFKIFQTLKPKDEIESTGIGLSLVKRYVERHGGTVRVRSTVGDGSEFCFTVLKRPDTWIMSKNGE